MSQTKPYEVKKLILPPEQKPKCKIPRGLPNHPFRWGITGMSGSGKGGMLVSVLNDGYKKYFHKRHFFCSTWDQNRIYTALIPQKGDRVYSGLTDKI